MSTLLVKGTIMELRSSLLVKAAFILVITLVLGCDRNEPTYRILMTDALYLNRMNEGGSLTFLIYKEEDRASALIALRVFNESLPTLAENEMIEETAVQQLIFHYNIGMRGRLAKVYYEMQDEKLGDEQIEIAVSFAGNSGAVWAKDIIDRESVLAFVELLDDANLP